MAGSNLPTNRTTSSTSAQHVSDHNAAHAIVNAFDTTIASAASLGYVPTWNGTVYTPQPSAGSSGAVTFSSLPAGSMILVPKVGGVWPTGYASDGTPSYSGGTSSTGVRPTSRADLHVVWSGADPSPAEVGSGTAGMLTGSDFRWKTP